MMHESTVYESKQLFIVTLILIGGKNRAFENIGEIFRMEKKILSEMVSQLRNLKDRLDWSDLYSLNNVP